MKKVFLVILPALLFVACKSEPVKTETRMYELTFVDGKTEIYTINNVDVNAQAFSQLDEYNKGGATQHNLLWKAMGNIEDALKELEDE